MKRAFVVVVVAIFFSLTAAASSGTRGHFFCVAVNNTTRVVYVSDLIHSFAWHSRWNQNKFRYYIQHNIDDNKLAASCISFADKRTGARERNKRIAFYEVRSYRVTQVTARDWNGAWKKVTAQ